MHFMFRTYGYQLLGDVNVQIYVFNIFFVENNGVGACDNFKTEYVQHIDLENFQNRKHDFHSQPSLAKYAQKDEDQPPTYNSLLDAMIEMRECQLYKGQSLDETAAKQVTLGKPFCTNLF